MKRNNAHWTNFVTLAKSTLAFIVITILGLNPAALAALTVGTARPIGRPYEYPTPFTQAIISDNDGYDYVAAPGADLEGKSPVNYIKVRKYAHNQPVTDEVRVDTAEANVARFNEPQLCAIPNGTLYLVYQKLDVNLPRRWVDIFFSRSLDSGLTWTAPQKLNTPGSVASLESHPTVMCTAVGGTGIIAVAWMTHDNPQQPRYLNLYFTRSFDNGDTWLSEVKINDDNSRIHWNFQGPALFFQGPTYGSAYIAWIDSRNDPQRFNRGDFYLSRSTDNGVTWGPNVRVNHSPGTVEAIGQDAHLAADENGNVYATWTGEGGIYFNRSLDSAETWESQDTRISADGKLGFSGYKSFAADHNGRVYVAYLGPSPGLKFRSSSNFGRTWDTEQMIIEDALPYRPPPYGLPESYTMATDQNGSIFLIAIDFNEKYSAYGSTLMNASDDGGATWACGTRGCRLGRTQVQPLVQGEISCNAAGHSAVIWSERRGVNDEFPSLINYGDFAS